LVHRQAIGECPYIRRTRKKPKSATVEKVNIYAALVKAQNENRLTISQLAWPGMIVEIDVTAIVPLK
jgi:hypothetical protein